MNCDLICNEAAPLIVHRGCGEELAPDMAQVLDAHLKRCLSCRELYEETIQIQARIDANCPSLFNEESEAEVARILAAIDAYEASRLQDSGPNAAPGAPGTPRDVSGAETPRVDVTAPELTDPVTVPSWRDPTLLEAERTDSQPLMIRHLYITRRLSVKKIAKSMGLTPTVVRDELLLLARQVREGLEADGYLT